MFKTLKRNKFKKFCNGEKPETFNIRKSNLFLIKKNKHLLGHILGNFSSVFGHFSGGCSVMKSTYTMKPLWLALFLDIHKY